VIGAPVSHEEDDVREGRILVGMNGA